MREKRSIRKGKQDQLLPNSNMRNWGISLLPTNNLMTIKKNKSTFKINIGEIQASLNNTTR